MSFIVKCVQTFLKKKKNTLHLKKGASHYFSCFQMLVTSRADYYLPKMHNLGKVHAVALSTQVHTCQSSIWTSGT